MPVLLEICVDSVESARAAKEGGADRLEVCAALARGGITPSVGLVEHCVTELQMPVMMMIRPHDGAFVYGDEDLSTMLSDIEIGKSIGVQGVVCGVLTEEGLVAEEQAKRLLEAADTLDTTFHRAFDLAADPIVAFETIQRLGFTRLLTSGQAQSAVEGADLIRDLVAASKTVRVLAGAGVDAANAAELVRRTGVGEIHASASEPHTTPRDSTPFSFGADRRTTSRIKVAAIVRALANAE